MLHQWTRQRPTHCGFKIISKASFRYLSTKFQNKNRPIKFLDLYRITENVDVYWLNYQIKCWSWKLVQFILQSQLALFQIWHDFLRYRHMCIVCTACTGIYIHKISINALLYLCAPNHPQSRPPLSTHGFYQPHASLYCLFGSKCRRTLLCGLVAQVFSLGFDPLIRPSGHLLQPCPEGLLDK